MKLWLNWNDKAILSGIKVMLYSYSKLLCWWHFVANYLFSIHSNNRLTVAYNDKDIYYKWWKLTIKYKLKLLRFDNNTKKKLYL